MTSIMKFAVSAADNIRRTVLGCKVLVVAP
jgi:hypothetical protein